MRRRKNIATVLFWIFLLALVVITLIPFAVMIAGSFKTDLEMSRYPLSIIPKDPILDNYRTLFETIPFWRQFFNSLMVSTLSAVGCMVINGLVAFGFTRFEFKGKAALFTILLATMMIPGQVYMVPQFTMYRSMGLFGTYVPLVVPSLMSAFGIYLIRQVMSQIPMELFESATIDGCSELRSFFVIAIPLAAAGIGIQGVLTFMAAWNDFMTPLIYLNAEASYTLPLGLMRLQNFYKITYGSPLAGAFLSCLPVIVILTVVGQKYFMQGLMAGAVKG